MPYLTDVIVRILVFYFLCRGAQKGFLRTLLGPFSLILACIIGFIYYAQTQKFFTSFFIAILGPFLFTFTFSFVLQAWNATVNNKKSVSIPSRLAGALVSLLWRGTHLAITLSLIASAPMPKNISWLSTGVGELISNQQTDTAPGGVNMTSNVLLYHLNEDALNMIDSSGLGNHLTEQSGVTFGQNGQMDKAIYVGGNGDNVRSSAYTYTFTTELTLSSWFKISGSGSGAPRILELSDTGNAYSHCLAVDSDGSLRGWADCTGGSIRVGSADDSTTYNDGNWHHFAYTYSSPDAIIYVDGQQTATGSGSCASSARSCRRSADR